MGIHIPQGNFQISNVPGRMQIFGVGVDYNLYTKWKNTTDPNASWSDWASMGGGTSGIANDTTASIGYLPDGRMQLFCVGNDTNIYSIWKVTTDPNAAWSEWASMGGRPGGGIAVGYLPDQRMQIFFSRFGENMYSAWKTSTDSDSPWSDWVSLGNPAVQTLGCAIGYLPDGRMQMFVIGADGIVYSIWKTTTDPDSPWSDWESIGTIPGGDKNAPGGSLPTSELTIGYLPDGRMQMFVVGHDHNLYSIWKITTDPNAAWSEWANMGRPGGTSLNNVSLGYLPDGRMQLFAADSTGTVNSIWKKTAEPDASWSDWSNMGGGTDGISFTTIGYLPDGRMQLFATALGYALYSIWKKTTAPDAHWSDWESMGSMPGGGIPDGVTVGYLPYEGT